jgi:hypothetical protein
LAWLTLDTTEPAIKADKPGTTAFRDMTFFQPAPLLNLVVRWLGVWLMPPFEYICIRSPVPEGPILCALINGDLGWLMYLREEGDSGFSSRNPNYNSPAHAQIEYRLDNGQHDLYPASWALPVEEVRRAIEYFEREHQRPPFVVWHED